MSLRTLFVVGATHHTASLEVREKLTVDESSALLLAEKLRQISGLHEFALLNTCNRVEIYGVGADDKIGPEVESALCTQRNFSPEEFAKIALRLDSAETLRHLMQVAAGVDSQLVGEVEIFGQVKAAYENAQAQKTTGPILNRSFQRVFQAAKQVRADTAIGAGQVSIANVAVELAGNIFGDLSGANVLLLGAGEVGEKTARAFRTRGAKSITVCSRSPDRALELAQALGASAMPFEQRSERLAEFDVIVCATSAPTAVIDARIVREALHRRLERPLFFIDLALPRDVDPAVSQLENSFLYNLDDLAKIADANRSARLAELEKCQAIVTAKSQALWQQLQPHLLSGRGAGTRAALPSHPRSSPAL